MRRLINTQWISVNHTHKLVFQAFRYRADRLILKQDLIAAGVTDDGFMSIKGEASMKSNMKCLRILLYSNIFITT